MQRTFVMIKPAGVKRGLVGEIIGRFEHRGLKIDGMKMLRLSKAKVEEHYAEHRGKAFFEELVHGIASGPVVVMVVRGPRAIEIVRRMMGSTDPVEALPGTIRGDYALQVGENMVHGSDSADSAERETALFFTDDELHD